MRKLSMSCATISACDCSAAVDAGAENDAGNPIVSPDDGCNMTMVMGPMAVASIPGTPPTPSASESTSACDGYAFKDTSSALTPLGMSITLTMIITEPGNNSAATCSG